MRYTGILLYCLTIALGCSSASRFARSSQPNSSENFTFAGQQGVASASETASEMPPEAPPAAGSRLQQTHGEPVRIRLVSKSSLESDLPHVPPPAAPPEPTTFADNRVVLTSDTPAAQPSAIVGEIQPITRGMTLASAEQMALNHNPTLVQLQHQITAARGRWIQGGLNPNPVLSLVAQEIGNEGTVGQNGISVSQEMVTADKLCLNQKVASWDIRQNELLLKVQRQRLLTDVQKQFYVAAVAQQRIELADELYRIAAANEAQATQLVKVQEPLTVLKQAQVEARLTQIHKQNAAVRANAEWQTLANLMGQPDLPSTPLDANFNPFTSQPHRKSLLQDIFLSSPELAAAIAAKERAAWAVRRACAGATPNYRLQGGAFHDASTDDVFANVQVSIPLTFNDVNQGNILEARSKLAAAAANVRRVKLQIQQRLVSAIQEYELAANQWSMYQKEIIPTAKETLELTQAAFRSGDASYLPVLTAQRSFSQVQQSYLKAQQQLAIAKAKIDGQLLEGSL